MSNSTLLASPETFFGIYEELTKYNVHLNIFERLWASWYAYMQNDVLATGIMSFAMHEIVYFGRCVPWMIIGKIPYFDKYKIQGAIDAHSGYEFPWSLHHFLPFWAGAEHHDLHHEKFIGNYASSFRWWDYVLDTESGAGALQKKREQRVKNE
ncbi:hypothetical protein DH86_00001249 [Scytalidium sp. 3C]|nr:hypothetical protein DH86_00001249 [Scytalidium sp. 3C]